MRRYRLIPIMLMIAALLMTGCNRNNDLSLSDKKTDSKAGQTAEATDTGKKTSSPEKTVKIQTWSEEQHFKYSPDKKLIYEQTVREPEVIIADDLQAQYRLNRYIRENDMPLDELYDIANDANDSYSYYKKDGEDSFRSYICQVDYSVLKNDGRVLSLKENYYTFTGEVHGTVYSAQNSYDTGTGQKITLNSLSNDPDGLKLTLRQAIADQAVIRFEDPAIAQSVMSAEIEYFVLLSEGIQVSYNSYSLGEGAGLGSQTFLVPYESLKNQFNDYGRQLTSYAASHEDKAKQEEAAPDFIFPQSSTAYLTGEDLLDVDKSSLRLARNEIYARYGREFKSRDLQDYFNQKSWYSPLIHSDTFDEGQLNDYEKKNVTAIHTAEDQISSKEITNHCVTLEPNRKYMLDLDGDGISETISWTSKAENGFSSQLILSINGQKQSCIPENLQGFFRISAVDLQKGDGEIELYLDASGDSDILESLSFYRYGNGKLEQIADLAGKVRNGSGYLSRFNGLRADGDGILAVRADSPFTANTSQFGCYYVDLLYSYKSGRLEELPQKIYPKKDYTPITLAFKHDCNRQYYLVSSEFTAMTDKGGHTPAFQARPGETVCPVAWSINGKEAYVLVMNEAGACGWVKDVPLEYEQNTNYYKMETLPVWG